MKYFVLGAQYVIRFDAGEKIIETLKTLCERDAIGGGYFHGLGAVGEAEIGHFDPASNAYSWLKVPGPSEIVSLYGNITAVDGRPFIHAHIALGDQSFAVRGGHLKEAVVSAACEVTLEAWYGERGTQTITTSPGTTHWRTTTGSTKSSRDDASSYKVPTSNTAKAGTRCG